jgi:CheY-like chemotaxis protein
VTVMIVESHDDTREMYAESLRAAGVLVTASADGATALALLGEADIDVLVCSLATDGIGGADLLRRLRALGRTMKAIALTGRVFEHEVEEALAAGFSEHIAKPCEPQALTERVLALARG